ncbi:TraX-like protein [Serratia quinivorans]|uniref:TraX-like protein n=1 Tax=Serratia quinivorans TaxID=137545 RepID=UPI0034C67239
MTEENPTRGKEKRPPGKLRKTVDFVTGVNELPEGKAKRAFYIITGVSDFYFIFSSLKQTVGLLIERLSFIKKQAQSVERAGDDDVGEESFDQVMSRSNKPVDELISTAGRYKRYWLVCLVLSVLASLFLISGTLRVVFSSGAGISIWKLLLTIVLVAAAGWLSYVKAVNYEFMGWKLRNRCNSEQEQGSYHHFVADGGRSKAFNFSQAGQERECHDEN